MLTKNLYITLFALFMLNGAQSFAQSETDTTIIVNGVCGMCKTTIEKAVNSLEGIEKASWDVDSKVLTLTFNSELVTLKEINDAVNKAGYDTEYSTANEEAYRNLNPCCQYRDPQVVKDHQ